MATTDFTDYADSLGQIWEAGEKGVLLATKKDKMHKRDKKMAKKHLFLAIPFPIEIRTLSPYNLPKVCGVLCVDPCLRRTGAGGNCGFGC